MYQNISYPELVYYICFMNLILLFYDYRKVLETNFDNNTTSPYIWLYILLLLYYFSRCNARALT
jgi:hypothetical protein